MSQIQPHFLYNSISAIQGLCIQNPEKAREALGDFAFYLRGNLNSLAESGKIPFEKELSHVETYLNLEKMRFEERLNVVYDIEETPGFNFNEWAEKLFNGKIFEHYTVFNGKCSECINKN